MEAIKDTGPPLSVLHGVDWGGLAYAGAVALVFSVLTTVRARRIQNAVGHDLSSWGDVFVDTLLGGAVGFVATVVGPAVSEPLKSFWGLTLLAAGGGAVGPYVTDWARENLWDVVLDLIAESADKLGTALKSRKGGRDDDDSEVEQGTTAETAAGEPRTEQDAHAAESTQPTESS